MSNWQYTDQSNRAVSRIRDDGFHESCLVEAIADWIAEGNTPLPSDNLPVKVTRVTMRQARLALLGADLLSTVNAAIAAMTGTQGEAARIEWEYSQEVQRDRGLVAALGTSLGLTEAQLDALFETASKIP